MPGTSIKIALLATLMVIALISASSGPASARRPSPSSGPSPATIAKCNSGYNQCFDWCDQMQPKTDNGSLYAQCQTQCMNELISCLSPAGPAISGGRIAQPTNLPNAPPKAISGLPPVNPVIVKQPVGGGGSSPPKVPIGVPPSNPVVVNQPGGNSGSGVTLFDKSGTGKSVTTTSPSGLTTTNVYDANGNFTITTTDPKGNILGKITTLRVTPTGMTLSTMTDAKGNVLREPLLISPATRNFP